MHKQKVWFITGASRGFGRIWTEAALQRGDKVAASARNIKTLDELVPKYGENLLPLQLDVTNREQVFQTINTAFNHFGQLDVIISNAGYGLLGAIEEVSVEDARKNMETNVFGTLSIIQAAVPLMRKQGSGHILTVSSLGGVVALPMFFQATKFAVEGMAEALSQEVAKFGIKITIIEPGQYNTTFFSDASIYNSAVMPEYDSVREALYKSFTPDMAGEPEATAAAILKVVDVENPPLRLILGTYSLPLIQQVYADRLSTWLEWKDVSDAAQHM